MTLPAVHESPLARVLRVKGHQHGHQHRNSFDGFISLRHAKIRPPREVDQSQLTLFLHAVRFLISHFDFVLNESLKELGRLESRDCYGCAIPDAEPLRLVGLTGPVAQTLLPPVILVRAHIIAQVYD